MASNQQTRIQGYLEKNKIAALLEELMAKLITDTPDQPIPFLIGYLQSKLGIVPSLPKTPPGSAALWAESESAETKVLRRDFRSYEKPWQGNAKKPKKSKSDLAVSNISPPSPETKSLPKSIEHPKWDWRTKPDSQDFDELNHILLESKKLGKALESLSRSIAITDELEQDMRAFNSSLLRPCVIGEWVGRDENDADPLAAEMLLAPIPRNKTEQWEGEEGGSSPIGSLKMEPKNKGLKQQQQQKQHKKLLAAMLSQDSFESVHSAAASATEEDIDNEDDAMELLEDLDDLRMEGVTSLMPSGSKFSQGRNTYSTEPQAKVTLNICSGCARLQGENLVEGAENISQEALSPTQAVPDTGASLPGVEMQMEDDEEFESASQVTGPRHPVWDSDALSVRSGGSQSQKLLKEALTAKELQSMEKHLADIEKDLALMAEARVSRSPSSLHSHLVTADNQGNIQALPGSNSRSQVSSLAGKSVQFPVQGSNPPQANSSHSRSQSSSLAGKSVQFPVQGSNSPPQANSRAQTTSLTNSRPQTPNSQTNKLQSLSAAGSRPPTPNSTLSRALSTGSQGNKEAAVGLQRSRSVTPRSQSGRPVSTPVRATVQINAENIGNLSHRSSFTEQEEGVLQLQAAHQPWTCPNDTKSEGVEGEPSIRF